MRTSVLPLLLSLSAFLVACGDGIGNSSTSTPADSTPATPLADSTANTNTPGATVVATPIGTNQTAGNKLRMLEGRDNGNNTVELLLQVKDEQGQPLATLGREDFSLFENDVALGGESSYAIDFGPWLDYQQNIQFAVDVSRSITALPQVRQALNNILIEQKGLDKRQSASIYGFDQALEPKLRDSVDINAIAMAIAQLQTTGVASTDLYGPLLELARKSESNFNLDRLSMRSVIVITDGDDTANRYELDRVIASIDVEQVFIVNIGADSAALRMLAGGGYYDGQSDLNTALQTALNDVKNYANSHYVLRYYSAKRAANLGSSAHILRASLSDGTGDAEFVFNSNDANPATRFVQISPLSKAAVGQNVELSVRVGPEAEVNEGRVQWLVNEQVGLQVCAIIGRGNTATLSMFRSGSCSITAGFYESGQINPIFDTRVISVN